MKYGLFFLTHLFFILNARADFNASNCDVSILDDPHMTAETRAHFAQPFDQGSTQLCYAHAASDLLSVVTGRSVAPLRLAILNFRSQNSNYDAEQSGEIVDALQVGNDGTPVCTTAGFNSRGFSATQLEHPPSYSCVKAEQIRVRLIGGTFYRDCLSEQVPRHFLPPAYKDRILAAINSELAANYPAGMSINLSQLAFVKLGQSRSTAIEAHAVSVIGRKWINGRCEYVFRNSYGPHACADQISPDRATCTGLPGFPAGTFSLSEQVLKEAMLRVLTLNHSSSSEIQVVTPDICTPAGAAPSSSESSAFSTETAVPAETESDQTEK